MAKTPPRVSTDDLIRRRFHELQQAKRRIEVVTDPIRARYDAKMAEADALIAEAKAIAAERFKIETDGWDGLTLGEIADEIAKCVRQISRPAAGDVIHKANMGAAPAEFHPDAD